MKGHNPAGTDELHEALGMAALIEDVWPPTSERKRLREIEPASEEGYFMLAALVYHLGVKSHFFFRATRDLLEARLDSGKLSDDAREMAGELLEQHERIKELGTDYRAIAEYLEDSVSDYYEAGHGDDCVNLLHRAAAESGEGA